MEADHAQEYYVLPLWFSYTSILKSSKAKNRDEKLNEDTNSKKNDEPVDQEDQAFLEELERLKKTRKEANDVAKTPRKTTPLNTASTPTNQDDSQIPSLEDIYVVLRDGIFSNASYDDENAVADLTNLESTVNVSPIPQSRIHSIHPTTQILGEQNSTVQTKSKIKKSLGVHAFVSYIQKQRRNNHKDFQHCLFAWIEAISIFLAFASYMGFIVYQIDMKSAFLYGNIDEEVYVSQPPGFIDPKFPNKVYKVVKALYGLHQAPRAWYATLSNFLVQSGYRRGLIDKTLFIKKDKKYIMLVHVYVYDIIFGSTKKSWCDEFEALMKNRLGKKMQVRLVLRALNGNSEVSGARHKVSAARHKVCAACYRYYC
nr:putative ribonuclease H-like domain-containing protein [Tanacetum cinerariifolium]